MLRPLKESEFDTYINFAYDLSQDMTRSGYPTYCDGIKTRADFVGRIRKSLERPGEDVLLFEENGRVEGLIAFEHQEGERYLHAHVFNIRRHTGTALAEFINYCQERWPGFDLDLGFPADNAEAVSWLDRADVPLLEWSWNYECFLDRYTPLPEDPSVRRVTAENFEEFAAIHRQVEGEMYWNCDRVQKTLGDWDIFVTGEGGAAGELLLTNWEGDHQEIFALEFADGLYREGPFRALLTASLNTLKERGAKYLTFFVNDGGECGLVLTKLGFQLVSGFVAYRLRL